MAATDLIERVSEIASLRRNYEQLQAEIAEKRAAWEKEHAIVLGTAKIAAKALADAETALKAVALARYVETEDVNPCPGVTVKMFGTMVYVETLALEWAKTRNLALLPESLDRKAFEKIAKATKLDFVQYIDEPRVQIAQDLTKALASVEVAPDAITEAA